MGLDVTQLPLLLLLGCGIHCCHSSAPQPFLPPRPPDPLRPCDIEVVGVSRCSPSSLSSSCSSSAFCCLVCCSYSFLSVSLCTYMKWWHVRMVKFHFPVSPAPHFSILSSPHHNGGDEPPFYNTGGGQTHPILLWSLNPLDVSTFLSLPAQLFVIL